MPDNAAKGSGLGAAEITALIRRRELSCVDVAAAANIAIRNRDKPIHAFAAQAGDAMLERAYELDRLPLESVANLPLFGVPVAIKDVFDTADLPTEYGSQIYRGRRPRADAAIVGLLRAAGALIIGKTKTAEFACMHPADTCNPLDLQRTPGGSSSGSAAAVAARLVPLATGTQTAGSVVRPASYCGVLGFKPTFGVVPLAGSLPTSSTLDTAGLFARSVEDLRLAFDAVSAAPPGMGSTRAGRSPAGAGPRTARDKAQAPRIGVVRMGWEQLEPAARTAIDAYLRLAAAAGASLEETTLPLSFEQIADAHLTIQRAETAWSLGREADWHRELVSAELRAYIADGRAISREQYLAARRVADEQRWRWEDVLSGLDAVIAPSALGVPPLGLEYSGDPLLCRPFTLFGGPVLALPAAWTPEGLPIGLQIASGLHTDDRLLDVAEWLIGHVGERRPAN
jgi:Asp-tRNA(Asn)/Glu-tRNA(Gln) amidotransferase A subunit family amidase